LVLNPSVIGKAPVIILDEFLHVSGLLRFSDIGSLTKMRTFTEPRPSEKKQTMAGNFTCTTILNNLRTTEHCRFLLATTIIHTTADFPVQLQGTVVVLRNDDSAGKGWNVGGDTMLSLLLSWHTALSLEAPG
jgi:hypothetical protein